MKARPIHFAILPVLLICGPGCISIQTYERQMKKCRDVNAMADSLQTQVTDLQKENSDLKNQADLTNSEKETLQGKITDIRGAYDELVEKLKADIEKGDVGVKEEGNEVTITVGNRILFKSGRASLQGEGKQVLARIAGVLKKAENRQIKVEGHTDNVPVSKNGLSQYPSNWELSAERAGTVVRFLQESGVDPQNLVLTAYGEFHPVSDNATANGRKLNRRVEIRLSPKPKS